MKKLCLLRYDTEAASASQNMSGFLERVLEVHRKHEIPVTLFCTGGAMEHREQEFIAFFQEIKGDPLFDIQDHSYSHVGVGYEAGKSIEVLRADYERSFAVHERLRGERPIGISRCGTGGADGKPLSGFGVTEKSRAEFGMLVDLGVRMIDAFYTGIRGSSEFMNYAALGHPEVCGYPSAHSDTAWLHRKEFGEPMEYILALIRKTAERGHHLPLMMHDWVVWNHSQDKRLSVILDIVDCVRECGFELRTHKQCYEDKSLWQ
ncbi:hypothetical protein ACFL6S_10240 [Candidatus Poribacteria bacterium]